MKKFNPTALVFGFFGLATIASMLGAVSGSLAWYAYATRAAISYSGTSVFNTMQLQVGIASTVRINGFHIDDRISETTFPDDEHYYYFSPAGVGLSSRAINTYLAANGYATNSLHQVTSGSFEPGDNFVLKEAPNERIHLNNKIAGKEYYAKIPFVFRALQSESVEDVFIPNTEIWLTDAKATASSISQGEVYKALRLYFERGQLYPNENYILNPSASVAGTTKVGGLLDFGRDRYYDFDPITEEEIIYGEYESRAGLSLEGYDGPNEYHDINGVGQSDTPSNFLARHSPGVKYFSSLENAGIKEAKYLSINEILPIKDSNNVLRNVDEEHPTSVCITGTAEDNYLGRVDMTVYLEGWDFAVIDQEIGHFFNIGLTFEINALRSN
jgi:hypothetical protein